MFTKEKTLMSNVSPSKAAELADVSRTTIYADMGSGKLSFTQQSKNKKTINVAELERVYGSLKVMDGQKVSSSVKTEQKDRTPLQSDLVELAVLREKVSNHEKLDEQNQERIEYLEKALDKAQTNAQRLLEDKSGESSQNEKWEKTMKALESRIANQEKAEKDRQEREQKLMDENKRIKQAYAKKKRELEEEQSKGFFKKLFG